MLVTSSPYLLTVCKCSVQVQRGRPDAQCLFFRGQFAEDRLYRMRCGSYDVHDTHTHTHTCARTKRDHCCLARALRIGWHPEHLVRPVSNQNSTKQGKALKLS